MKRVIVISASLRAGSNSDILADSFIAGAREAGNDVEKISLTGKDIRFCRGCFACAALKHCVIDDDVNEIMDKVLNADVVAWATPIYYYEMSGQMKTLIDRMNGLYTQKYNFRDVYLLTTAAEDEASVPKRAEAGLTGWIDCYPESRLKGTVFCGGVNKPHEIEGNPKLKEAYEMGLSVGTCPDTEPGAGASRVCANNPGIDCPCPKNCPRHGKCCTCVAHHREHGKLPACLRELNKTDNQSDMNNSDTFISAEGRDWEQFGPGLYRQILGYHKDMMSVRVRFDKGGIARMHSHPHTQTSCIISGRYEFTVDGVRRTVSAGDGVLILPGLMHECVCLEPGLVIDTFSPMRDDFLK